MDDRFQSWAKDFLEDTLAEAKTAEDGDFQANVFFRRAAEILVEARTCVDPIACPYIGPGMRVSGYDFVEDSDSMDLFVVDFDAATQFRTVRAKEIRSALSELASFLQSASRGLGDQLEESSEAFSLAQQIKQERPRLTRVRLFFITNGLTGTISIPDATSDRLTCSFAVWDLEALYQVVSMKVEPDQIAVDFIEEYGRGVPCVRMPEANGVYDVYLAVVPGALLSAIYGRYGQRLLERNVRAFLQTRGKVNKGILDTLRSEPHMFLAYNNGISTTADEVEAAIGANGELLLTRLKNLQIVNGGQTTASLHNAASRHDANLSGVFVQMKLTVLKDASREAEIVPLISKYANSQTKINVSDFAANDRFHVALEQLSQKVWVPNPAGKATTKWFYERALGSYLDELGRQKSAPDKRIWQAQYPSSQKLTKTLAAKYEMAWQQHPHRVSLGAEKNFAFFTSLILERRGSLPDERYFKHLIAKAILFRQCDLIARKMGVAGYKANAVAYAVSWLSYLTGQRLDLDWIWDHQNISPDMNSTIEGLLPQVVDHITSPPRAGMNVTEWCKKEDCWTLLKQQRISIGQGISTTRAQTHSPGSRGNLGAEVKAAPGDDPVAPRNIDQADGVEAAVWFGLSNWGAETRNFNGRENRFLYQMGSLVGRGQSLTPAQAKWAIDLHNRAAEAGFRS